jgi:hypothetical protein
MQDRKQVLAEMVAADSGPRSLASWMQRLGIGAEG